MITRATLAYLIVLLLMIKASRTWGLMTMNLLTKEPKPWKQENFPIPFAEQNVCRTSSRRLCDPNTVLTDSEIQMIDQMLWKDRNIPCTEPEKEDPSHFADVQFAVAVVRKMDLTSFAGNDAQSKAAESFARYVHDSWGVGIKSECGGTGVLLFLSDMDRSIYISRGSALEPFLTDARLDRVIEHMRALLRSNHYGDAIINALHEIDELIQKGEPKFQERVQDWLVAHLGKIVILLFFCFIFYSSRKQQAQRKEYVVVASKLDEIDRARAEALQGRYCAESCPICLERFHSIKVPMIGSDGLPIKLLRCGHVFDESCWEEWVSSGQGHVHKCPICQQDITKLPMDQTPQTTSESLIAPNQEGPDVDEQQIMRQYQRERNFRLARLSLRYPRFIRPQQVQVWTQSNYEGSLARDPSFLEKDPQRTTEASSSIGKSRSVGRSIGSISNSFGGGSSSSGRGGRW